MKLHPSQEKIYQIFKQNNNSLPSYREISRVIGVSSTNTVSHHIKQLKKKGYFGVSNAVNDIVPFNLKILLDFENKAGVYVLLKNKTPFYVGAAKDIKKDILTALDSGNADFMTIIKESAENIQIAYYIIKDEQKRNELKKELKEYYLKKGFLLQ